MSILLLGPNRTQMVRFLEETGEKVINWELPLDIGDPVLEGISFIISYGYRYILKKELVEKYHRRIINLHISLLPWNRGSDPNLWSFLEDTPKGVTIHYIDAELDTGDILVQGEVSVYPHDTLRTSYDRLSVSIESLFYKNWIEITTNQLPGKPQTQTGTYHRSRDKEPYLHLLTEGWDTPVASLIGKAKEKGKS